MKSERLIEYRERERASGGVVVVVILIETS